MFINNYSATKWSWVCLKADSRDGGLFNVFVSIFIVNSIIITLSLNGEMTFQIGPIIPEE